MAVLACDITWHLGTFALDARLEMTHAVTGIFGRSGSGKSSLLRAISGLGEPDRGTIHMGDTPLFDSSAGVDMPAHARRIGMVFQDARLFPHLSVQDNLHFGARYAPKPLSAAEEARIIDVLGIGGLLTRRPGHLSGGEQSRVALGRALMSAPHLLLLDEPMAALDSQRKAEILPYLERVVSQTGTPMLYVSHDMDEIVRFAGGLAILRDGKIAAQGALEQVLSDPALVPVIGAQDAGAVLSGTLQTQASDGLSTISLSQGLLHVPRIEAAPGTRVRLRVRAQDVTLATYAPNRAEISALNILQ